MDRCLLLVFLSLFTANSALADPLVAKIQPLRLVYAKRPLTLDGSGSTQGSDVTYKWAVAGSSKLKGAPADPPIEDADKVVAHFTPPAWGVYGFTLTVSQGANHQDARLQAHVINDPAKDDSPSFEGASKVLYKQAPDALGATAKLYLHVFNPTDWKATDKRG